MKWWACASWRSLVPPYRSNMVGTAHPTKSPMKHIFTLALLMSVTLSAVAQEPLKIGIIGLDTSHSIAFTKDLNSDKAPPELANCKVVAAYPHGSADIEGSTKRIPGYTDEIKKFGVEVVDSIDELLKRVDCVLLETND